MFMNIYRDTAIILCSSSFCFSINISILATFSMFKGLTILVVLYDAKLFYTFSNSVNSEM